jgi:hypothetical protein
MEELCLTLACLTILFLLHINPVFGLSNPCLSPYILTSPISSVPSLRGYRSWQGVEILAWGAGKNHFFRCYNRIGITSVLRMGLLDLAA